MEHGIKHLGIERDSNLVVPGTLKRQIDEYRCKLLYWCIVINNTELASELLNSTVLKDMDKTLDPLTTIVPTSAGM